MACFLRFSGDLKHRNCANLLSYKRLKYKFVGNLKQIPVNGILVKFARATISAVSQCFRANQIGFEEIFDNLTFKPIHDTTKKIRSLVDYVLI